MLIDDENMATGNKQASYGYEMHWALSTYVVMVTLASVKTPPVDFQLCCRGYLQGQLLLTDRGSKRALWVETLEGHVSGYIQ